MNAWGHHLFERVPLLEQLLDSQPCPQENEVNTRPFLVDPVSKAEVPARVVQVSAARAPASSRRSGEA